ncbi:unannotated protein [freshwater metagenome]|uniref:Unannotated protein n=1 Tax=freshwater metagenome TaxID=449393 RepID=A0A6J7EYG1_9ZZZZ
MVPVLAQPFSGAWMSPNTRVTMPTVDRMNPGGSSLPWLGSLDFGRSLPPLTRARTMIGTFTRNTDPYQKWPSSQPLKIGPSVPPTPLTLAHMAIAFWRSCGGKMLTRIESVDGITNAAASPMSPRQRINCIIECDCEARTLPTRKMTRPTCSAPLRPNRSPIAADVNSRPANTSE